MSGFVSSRYYTQYKTECAQVEISAALSPADTTHDTGQNVLRWKYQQLCLQQILHTIQDRMCSGGNISSFVSSKYNTSSTLSVNIMPPTFQPHNYYSMSRKKDQIFAVISSIKLRRF